MTLLTDAQSIVLEVLSDPEIGRSVTIRRVTTTSGGPSGSPTRSTEEIPARAYFDRITEFNAPAGSLIETGDRLAYIIAEDVDEPVRLQDEIVRDGEVFQVQNVQPVELGSGSALWIAQLRN